MESETQRIMRSASDEYWLHTQDMAFIKRADGVYLRVSAAFAEMVGLPGPEAAVGLTDSDIFADQELARRYMDDDARLLAQGNSIERYVEPITQKDGRPRYALTSKYVLRDDSGNALGVFGTGRDITVEYEARQVYESELKSLFVLPPDALAAVLFDVTAWRVVDRRCRGELDGVYARFSQMDDYFAHAAASVVEGDDARDYFAGLNRAHLQRAYGEGKRNRAFEYLRRMPDGTEKWVRDDLHFLLDPVNGNLSLIVILRDIDRSKREYSDLVCAAIRDSMTGLLNHDATIKRIEEFLSQGEGLHALFMIDLDNFKLINDTFGHQYGDSILISTAESIRSSFRASDEIGRLGGDEFMVLMKNVPSEDRVRRKAEELIFALQFTSSSPDKALEMTTSVGITLFDAAHRRDFSALYGEADDALYQAKREGKNRYCIYNAVRNESAAVFYTTKTVQLQTLFEYMDGGVIMAEVTDDIHVTYISPSFFRSFNRDPRDVRNSLDGVFTYVLADDLPGFRSALFHAAEKNEPLDYTYRVAGENGGEWRRIRVKRIPDTGDGVCRIVAIITDVTGFKRANEQLRKTEERYRSAVDQADAMLWEVDLASRTLTLTSPAWEKFSFDRLVFPDAPESYIAVGAIHPDSRDTFRRMFNDIYAGRESAVYCLKHYGPGGAEVWIKDLYRLLRDENGKPLCALGITLPVPNISADMHRFEHEMNFSIVVRDWLAGCVRANFSRNVLESFDMGGDPRYGRLAGARFDECFRFFCERAVDRRDRAHFRAEAARPQLLARFQAGERWRYIDFRRLDASGQPRWANLFLRLMRHPISGDVYVFGYVRDNETRRNWELTLGTPLVRSTAMPLYSQDSMAALARHVIATRAAGEPVAVSVIELLGLDRIRREKGEAEVGEVLFTFGRLCRTVVDEDVIMGQLDESRVAFLRVNAQSNEAQREWVSALIRRFQELLAQARPDATVGLIGGSAVAKAGQTAYGQLLRNADIAVRSIRDALDEPSAAYADMDGEAAGEPGDGDDSSARTRLLEARCRQMSSMLRLSENDELTGILGRQAFYRHVRSILDASPEKRCAIVRFDINRFKVFNDVRGTAAGDRLLRDIVAMFQCQPGAETCCARLESDHFALLVPDDAVAIRRSKDALAKWLTDYAPDYRLSGTIGVYSITDPSVEVSLMCDRALLALRSVKSGFETRIAWYDETLRRRLLDEQRLMDDMEAALHAGQFELYFQPQMNYEDGTLVGAEALVRWRHPARGLLSPAAFIPLFERNGLITKLDEYVWERSCRYIRAWTDKYDGAREKPISVAVNVSRLDIYDPHLCQTLNRIIEQYALPHAALRLEITESAYMDDPKQLIETVGALQAAGFTVEIDDFGSGYSSLNTLKDVAVDVLKLDMKFLADCADSARGGNVLSSVIRMAHWLKLPIIAEGVETKEQADYLKSLGCIYMQGYYFGRPMPADEYEALLARRAGSTADQYKGVSVEGMAEFWNPAAQQTLLFNSFVGGAAIMEYQEGLLEALRVNDNYYKTLGTTREAYLPVQTDILRHFDAENGALLTAEIERAISTGEECGCTVKSLPGVGGITRPWMRCRIRLLAQSDSRAILYVSIEDVTERKRLEREQAAETERNRLLMQTTGICFFDYDYAADTMTFQSYLADRGDTRRVVKRYHEYLYGEALIDEEGAARIGAAIDEASRQPARGELEFRANLWNTGMRWCRARYVCVTDAGGRVYRMTGQVDDIQDIKDRAAIAESIRRQRGGEAHSFAFNDEVVNQIVSLFYATDDIEGAIKTTLALVGEYYNLSRAYIFEDYPGHTAAANTYEWCARGVEPQKESLQNVTYADMGGRAEYIGRFDQSGVYYCPDIRALSPESRAILEPQGIYSMLHCAIRDRDVFGGFIGFDECREHRRWTDEQVGTLMFVSRVVALYLLRMRQAETAASSSDFRAALDNAAFAYIVDPATFEIVYVNKAIEHYSGQSCLGMPCYRAFIGRDEPCVQCPVRHMRDPSGTHTAEVRRSDGMLVMAQASPLHWNGRDLAILFCINITDRQQVEAALAAERQKTVLMLEAASLTVWTYDIAADCFRVQDSSAVNGQLVIPGAYRALIGAGIVLPDSAGDYAALHEKLINGETSASAVIRFDPARAPAEWMRISYTAVSADGGAPEKAIGIGQAVASPG